MRISSLLLTISALTGTRSASNESHLEKVKQNTTIKETEPVALNESPANQPIKELSNPTLPASVTETEKSFEISTFHSVVIKYLKEASHAIETKLLELLKDIDIDQPKVFSLREAFIIKLETTLLETEQRSNHDEERADSNNGRTNSIHPALALLCVGILFLAYLYVLKTQSGGTDADGPNLTEQAAAFSLKNYELAVPSYWWYRWASIRRHHRRNCRQVTWRFDRSSRIIINSH